MRARSVLFVALLCVLSVAAARAQAQDERPDQPCTGSQPEPAQSASWGVAFCNRTNHDLVVQFRDNECPVQNWARRGDVYQKVIRRGESTTVFLCYANEPQKSADPPPGVPKLRVPGGKGVVTTWSVVGDCGERSDQSRVDSRSFYDRGEYNTGIILLQHPQGASHCFGETASSAPAPAAVGTPARDAGPAAASARVTPAAATVAPTAPAAVAAAAAAAPAVNPASPASSPASAVLSNAASASYAAGCAVGTGTGGGRPSLCAAVDVKDAIKHKVYVFSTTGADEPAYKCSITLAVRFTDGGTWNDRFKADIPSGQTASLVSTRKYLKTVDKVVLASRKCEG